MRVLSSALLRLLQVACGRNARGMIVNSHVLSAGQTRVLVEQLGKRLDFIALDQLAVRIATPGRRPFCLLTFDDGHRSNATETAPELLRLGVPAVFYVTTGFLDTGRPLWFDRYATLRRAGGCLDGALSLPVLKQLPLEILEERLDRSFRDARLEFNPDSDHVRAMTWEEVGWLASQGFTVGAHGVEHAVLTRETWPTAVALIRESICAVTDRIGRPCTSFAFPNGNYSAALCREALGCGVTTVMTTEPMWVDADCLPWRLPRIQLFPVESEAKVVLKLALALAKGVIENPDGTGRAYRRIELLRRRKDRTNHA